MGSVEVVVRSTPEERTKGWLASGASEVADVDVLGRALSQLTDLVPHLPAENEGSGWRLREIELSAEVTAEGGLRLLATASASVSGTVTVRLARE